MNAKRFRLLSSRLVCTPGLLARAIAGFKGGDRKDRRLMVNLLVATFPG
jgi:hypothetical protein